MAAADDVAALVNHFRGRMAKSAFLPMPGGEPMDPNAGAAPTDPSAAGGAPVDPATGAPMDPNAGMPADPSAGGAPAPDQSAAASPADVSGGQMTEDQLMQMPLGQLSVGDFMEVLHAMIQAVAPAPKGAAKPKGGDIESRLQALEQAGGEIPAPVGAMPAGSPAPAQPAEEPAPQQKSAAVHIIARRLGIKGM